MPSLDRSREHEARDVHTCHGEDERIAIVLTFGYPARPSDPAQRTPEEWIERANRRPFDEIVDLR